MRSFIRFISRNKLYSAIEAVGLSVSLAFLIIIFCNVMEQMGIPRENPDYKNIYALGRDESLSISYGTKDALEDKIPEIEKISRFASLQNLFIEAKDLKIRENILACDREYFDLFPVKFISGEADMIDNDGCAFVSQKLANSIDTEEIVGTKLMVADQEYVIAGVISDFQNTLLPDADVAVEISKFNVMKDEIDNPYNYFGRTFTFAKISPNVDLEDVKNKIDAAYEMRYGSFHSTMFEEATLVRLDDVYFSNHHAYGLRKGDKSMMNNLLAVGLLLLVSAIINYINLTVALTGKRSKEMASRRLVGAQKTDIIGKYLVESFAFTFVCFLIGLGLAYLILPLINQLLDASLPIRISLSFKYLCSYLLIISIVSFLAGIMPALLISKARPIDVVKGQIRLHNKMIASKVFIVIQNAMTIVLISLVLTMELQMRHLQNKDVGCRTHDLYFLDASFTLNLSHLEALANDLQALPCVSRFGTTMGVPTDIPNITYCGRLNDKDKYVALMTCDSVALDMLEIPILNTFGEKKSNSCYMTESTVAEFTGLPKGEINVDSIMKWQQHNFRKEICGVVGDFMIKNVLCKESFGMVVLADYNYNSGFLMEIKGDHKEAKEAINALYKKYIEEAQGVYIGPACNGFLDDIVIQCLEKPRREMRLMELFMLISVILSLLGLVAMSTHFASEREKTIAIRKIFGGTMESEVRKNLRDYVIIILIANVIAIPIGEWLCGKYLEDFAYRIDLHPWIFIVTVLISFAIAIGSVLWQIVSVAKVNPAEALKKE